MKPPYGRISAIDMTRGEILWQVAHGETPDDIKSHPLLQGLTIPRTGQAGSPGTLVTKTLLVSGERLNTTTPEGVGAMLRAYDKATGREVGAVYMPAPQSGSPMTYLHERRAIPRRRDQRSAVRRRVARLQAAPLVFQMGDAR